VGLQCARELRLGDLLAVLPLMPLGIRVREQSAHDGFGTDGVRLADDGLDGGQQPLGGGCGISGTTQLLRRRARKFQPFRAGQIGNGEFGKLFKTHAAAPADAAKLDGTTEATLVRSLSSLPPGERGWITFAEARTLFSTKSDQYAFGEQDDAGRRNIETFAAQHRAAINFMPLEARVYFVRTRTQD
jgi:hypothetical protein